MAQIIVDKATGARFRVRSSPEQRERDAVHHGPHFEELIRAIYKVLTPAQKEKVREHLKDCVHNCVRRTVESA